jgi:hypothetical protein
MGFGGSSGGSSTVSGASDVAMNSPIDAHVFTYDSSTTKWGNGATRITVSYQTASYTLALVDAGRAVEINSSSATTLTIPTNTSVAFPIGTVIEITQIGTGAITITPASGVTLQSASNRLRTNEQYSAASIRKRSTNTWLVVGDLV